jgi:hypothetical protein
MTKTSAVAAATTATTIEPTRSEKEASARPPLTAGGARVVRGDHACMDTPRTPIPPQPNVHLQAKVAQWLELKREMQALHAKLEYARLMLKLGVRHQAQR